MENNLIKSEIESRIYLYKNQQIMLASDLAELYGLQTKVINQSVKRNIVRFPEICNTPLLLDQKVVLLS